MFCLSLQEPDEPALTEEPAGAKGGEEEDEGLPPYLALELEKQQQLYNEIMSKTKKLKDLRTVSVVETVLLSKMLIIV